MAFYFIVTTTVFRYISSMNKGDIMNGVGIMVGCKVRHVTDIWNKQANYGLGTVVAPDSWGGWIVDFENVPAKAYMEPWLVKVDG
jgi:hypothetical protein